MAKVHEYKNLGMMKDFPLSALFHCFLDVGAPQEEPKVASLTNFIAVSEDFAIFISITKGNPNPWSLESNYGF